MAKEKSSLPMEMSTLDSINQANLMDMANMFGQMEILMKAILLMGRGRVKEHSRKSVENFMKECLKMIRNMDWASKNLNRDNILKDNGNRVKDSKVSWKLKMELKYHLKSDEFLWILHTYLIQRSINFLKSQLKLNVNDVFKSWLYLFPNNFAHILTFS